MITIAVADGVRTFAGELGAGDAAFVDADWLLGAEDAVVPAIVAPAGSQSAVAAVLAAVADEAAAAAGVGSRRVVHGDGFVARRARELLGLENDPELASPEVVVETRSGAACLVESTQRVTDLGTVVVALPPEPPSFAFDLYRDVHVRGLRLVAVGLPRNPRDGGDTFRIPPGEEPATVRLGEPIPTAAWYRVVA